jgi:hypothetical protein
LELKSQIENHVNALLKWWICRVLLVFAMGKRRREVDLTLFVGIRRKHFRRSVTSFQETSKIPNFSETFNESSMLLRTFRRFSTSTSRFFPSLDLLTAPWKQRLTPSGWKRKRNLLAFDSEWDSNRCHALIVLLQSAQLAVVNLHFVAKLQEMWPKSDRLANDGKLDWLQAFRWSQTARASKQIETERSEIHRQHYYDIYSLSAQNSIKIMAIGENCDDKTTRESTTNLAVISTGNNHWRPFAKTALRFPDSLVLSQLYGTFYAEP